MRRALRFSAWTIGAAVLAAGISQAGRALAGMDAFRIQDHAVEGTGFLDADEAVRWARIPEGASVWDDPAEWERRLEAHPLVDDAEIVRDLPHTVVFRIRERRPVALVPTPTLEPVDADGTALPLNPADHRLDLPVIHPRTDGTDHGLTPDELHGVTEELGRLASADPSFLATVSDVELGRDGELVATLIDPAVRLHFRPPLTPLRLRDAIQAAGDAEGRAGPGELRRIDLRFDDQVVVELAAPPSTRMTD